MAGKRAAVHLPTRWNIDRKAKVLYNVGARIREQLRAASVRCCAYMHVRYLLRCCNLPPLVVPPLKVPISLYKRHSALRILLRDALHGMRCEPARSHLAKNLNVIPARRARWVDRLNAKRYLKDFAFDPADTEGLTAGPPVQGLHAEGLEGELEAPRMAPSGARRAGPRCIMDPVDRRGASPPAASSGKTGADTIALLCCAPP